MTTTKAQRSATAYVTAVVTAGVVVFAYSVRQLYLVPVSSQWFILAALTLLTGSFAIGMEPLPARVSVSETFVFASVLLYGPAAGTITVILESLVMSFWLPETNRSSRRTLFNAAATALAIWTSGTVFYWVIGVDVHKSQSVTFPTHFFALAVFTVLYFLLNSWLVATAVALHSDRSPMKVWWPQFTWLSINYFAGASAAALIVTYRQKVDTSTLLIILPLLVVSYVTFRTAMARVSDAAKHLGQLNSLYLSTIETLAMAIDAKDQITHGHIRRVQGFAVGLAKRVGISDESLIRAIEAASLLHDTGKLAVPEYILNKPGRLTPAEFEKMKLHASVGADILSAIDFPYPVVPIVRHHHENWDGSGYPDGLKGTDIPIGARILSIVDCFDALTSDRPYRPRLSRSAALEILLERRGSMYDPLIVDTFVKVHDQIEPSVTVRTPSAALQEIASSRAGNSMPTPLSNPAHTPITSPGAKQDGPPNPVPDRTNARDAYEAMEKQLRSMVPFSLLVLYIYDAGSDELVVAHASGEMASRVQGLRMAVGERISGWVAANRMTILNSDPVLDLGQIAKDASPALRSCLCVPLVSNDALVGVLSLHAAGSQSFSANHQNSVETIAIRTAIMIGRSALLGNYTSAYGNANLAIARTR
jgi:HD-GYP domain-containing protein (c-di-GMP phosphodiesterase class II)/putative methionine-R-sulfoxide reductase with GAF domain